MKPVWIATLIVCLGISAACKKPTDVETTRTIQLHGCTALPGNHDLHLCFESVISDSRCPTNAVCIWSGTAVARFAITLNDARLHELTLATPLPLSYGRDTIVAGYKIEFVNLYPHPDILRTTPVTDDEIKAEVKITKL